MWLKIALLRGTNILLNNAIRTDSLRLLLLAGQDKDQSESYRSVPNAVHIEVVVLRFQKGEAEQAN